MSPDGIYDMVLLPSQHDHNDGRQLTRRRRTRRRLPPVAEDEHLGLPCHPPRRRRRRGNRGQAGGGTSSAVGLERADDAGTPAGVMSGVVLAPETTTGVASQQRANPKRTADVGTLAGDLSDICLAPEIKTHSVPDATSPPSINQEVPSVFHPVPFRFSFDPPSDPASVSAFARAYPDLPGYHMWSTWDRLTAVSTYGPVGSEEEDDPTSVGISPDSVIPVPCETSCQYVTTASPAVLMMTIARRQGLWPKSRVGITTKTTTSACQKMTTPLCMHLVLRSRGS
jgi:hypothetical protein